MCMCINEGLECHGTRMEVKTTLGFGPPLLPCLKWCHFFEILILFDMFDYFACMYVCRSSAVSAQRGCQILWKWSYRHLLAAMWVLGLNPMFFLRTSFAGNCWVIPSAQALSFAVVCTLYCRLAGFQASKVSLVSPSHLTMGAPRLQM